jgi:hypothetical protein
MDYTIIGGPVNIASRLQMEAPVGSILLSYETYAHVKDEVYCEKRAQIKLKGAAYPIGTYEVIDLLENIAPEARPLKVDLPHLRFELDPRRMSAAETEDARKLLQSALKRLKRSRSGALKTASREELSASSPEGERLGRS